MERTAQNRVIFWVGVKKEKSRNPHGYWIFRWRSGWDSNPRAREDYLISSQARYDHFDTAPYMLSRRFSPPFFDRKRLWKELTERTANLFNFRTGQNPHGYKVFGGRNGHLPAGFRVLHLRPLGQLSICQSENRSQNFWKELTERTAKYSVFRTAGARRNTGFLADKTDTFSKIFECAPLWPLRYFSSIKSVFSIAYECGTGKGMFGNEGI